MKKIIITSYIAEYDCECCGFNSNYCVDIEVDNIENLQSTTLGNPHCTAMENAYLYDALKYIFNELKLYMPYTIHTEKAIKLVGDRSAYDLYEEGKIGYRTYIRALNPRFKIAKGSTLQETAINFMKSHGYDLKIHFDMSHDE